MRYSSPTCHKHIKGRAIKSFWHNDTYNSPITSFNCMLSVNLTQIVFKKCDITHIKSVHLILEICLTFLLKSLIQHFFYIEIHCYRIYDLTIIFFSNLSFFKNYVMRMKELIVSLFISRSEMLIFQRVLQYIAIWNIHITEW